MTDFFVNAVSNSSNKKHQPNQAFAELELDNCHHVQFKTDTGAQVNMIPKSVYGSFWPLPKLPKTDKRLTGYQEKEGGSQHASRTLAITLLKLLAA